MKKVIKKLKKKKERKRKSRWAFNPIISKIKKRQYVKKKRDRD